MPNLVCTHCNMNGHTADRCFELVGYPPNLKKNNNNGFNKGVASSNVVSVSKLNMTVGHPSGTMAIVTHVGSHRLIDQIVIHDVLVVPEYKVSILSVHKLSKDNKFRVVFDENVCVIQRLCSKDPLVEDW
ncbi:hypothetical protein Tco_1465704 [Tanacetum coccineum]